jgi:hypothetical protein
MQISAGRPKYVSHLSHIMCLYVWLLVSIVAFLSTTSATPDALSSSIKTIIPDLLTVTTAQFSVGTTSTSNGKPSAGARPPWVLQLFGTDAVFYGSNADKVKDTFSNAPLKAREINHARETMQRAFAQLEELGPGDSTRRRNVYEQLIHISPPQCSLQMLGFLNCSHFTNSLDRRGPYVGISRLKFISPAPRTDIEWQCLYRGLYENWRFESKYAAPHYRTIALYCYSKNQYTQSASGTSSSDQSCADLQTLVQSSGRGSGSGSGSGYIKARLSMPPLRNGSTALWTEPFDIIAPAMSQPQQSLAVAPQPPSTHDVAICLVVPYTSSEAGKRDVNNAMIAEWIRYYQLLGMTIIIYDRDGANEQAIFSSSAYRIANNIPVPFAIGSAAGSSKGKEDRSRGVYYYNYTIRGLLDPSRKHMKYDNTEPWAAAGADYAAYAGRKSRFESQGHDKVLTNSHCRFEVMSQFARQQQQLTQQSRQSVDAPRLPKYVMVADFDEFLFCPSASSNILALKQYLSALLQREEQGRVQQLLFQQRQTLNITESPTDCMSDVIANANIIARGQKQIAIRKRGRSSLFQCFAANQFYMGGHSVKAVYLDHSCPLTGKTFLRFVFIMSSELLIVLLISITQVITFRVRTIRRRAQWTATASLPFKNRRKATRHPVP